MKKMLERQLKLKEDDEEVVGPIGPSLTLEEDDEKHPSIQSRLSINFTSSRSSSRTRISFKYHYSRTSHTSSKHLKAPHKATSKH